MNLQPSSDASQLLLFELLSSHEGKPAALLLQFEGDGAGLIALIESPEFRALAAQNPCVVVERPDSSPMASDFAQALRQVGCQSTTADAIHRTATLQPGAAARRSGWIGGDWYLAAPSSSSGNHNASRSATLHLLQLVTEDAETRELETVFKREPALSYHLLRLVNSVGIGENWRITSLSQAIVVLGRQQLRRWLNLLLFAAREDDPRTGMLLARAVVHARLVELLAQESGQDKAAQDQAFMAGLFSLLGILFGMPLVEILQPLRISDVLRAALARREGRLGRLLDVADAAMARDIGPLASRLDAAGIAAGKFNLLEVRAYSWMFDILRGGWG